MSLFAKANPEHIVREPLALLSNRAERDRLNKD